MQPFGKLSFLLPGFKILDSIHAVTSLLDQAFRLPFAQIVGE